MTSRVAMSVADIESVSVEWWREQQARWMRTGYGVDPNQIGLRHYPDGDDCKCCTCAGTPVYITQPPPEFQPELIRRGLI
jgi:hypothetical protein